ncbi:MAG: phage tail tape measure C-terminal domain-containing protein [Pseudomonadota bacterium]
MADLIARVKNEGVKETTDGLDRLAASGKKAGDALDVVSAKQRGAASAFDTHRKSVNAYEKAIGRLNVKWKEANRQWDDMCKRFNPDPFGNVSQEETALKNRLDRYEAAMKRLKAGSKAAAREMFAQPVGNAATHDARLMQDLGYGGALRETRKEALRAGIGLDSFGKKVTNLGKNISSTTEKSNLLQRTWANLNKGSGVDSLFGKFSVAMSGIAATLFVFQQVAQWVTAAIGKFTAMEESMVRLNQVSTRTSRENQLWIESINNAVNSGLMAYDAAEKKLKDYTDAGYSAVTAQRLLNSDIAKMQKDLTGTMSGMLSTLSGKFDTFVKNTVRSMKTTFAGLFTWLGDKLDAINNSPTWQDVSKEKLKSINEELAATRELLFEYQSNQTHRLDPKTGAVTSSGDEFRISKVMERAAMLEKQKAILETTLRGATIAGEAGSGTVGHTGTTGGFTMTDHERFLEADRLSMRAFQDGATSVYGQVQTAGRNARYIRMDEFDAERAKARRAYEKERLKAREYGFGTESIDKNYRHEQGQIRLRETDYQLSLQGKSIKDNPEVVRRLALKEANSAALGFAAYDEPQSKLEAEKEYYSVTGKMRDNHYQKQVWAIKNESDEFYRLTEDKIAAEELYHKRVEELDISRSEGAKEWQGGARRALKNYVETASDSAAQSKRVFTDAFGGMEDALVEFTRTGQLSFENMANNIINDLIRIQIQKSMLLMSDGSDGGFGGILGKLIGGAIGGTAGAGDGWGTAAGANSTYGPSVLHGGGVVGSTFGPYRHVDSGLFDHAQRFHQGLAGDEFPAILQRGESVLTPKQMAAASSPQIQVVLVNKSGAEMKKPKAEMSQGNMGQLICTVVLEAASNNTGGFKDGLSAILSS